MQKIQWKCSNDQLHRSYKVTSMTFWSSLLKTIKTRQTKTYITQNFEQVSPFQGRTMWKLTSWGFQKCSTFWVLKVLNQSYWLSKSGEISKKKIGVTKKRHAANFENWRPKRIEWTAKRVVLRCYSFRNQILIIVAVSFFLTDHLCLKKNWNLTRLWHQITLV